MKIKLDRTLCDGFGTCAMHAPSTFSLDEWGFASLIGSGSVAEQDEDGVRRALLDCPVHAILELDPDGLPVSGGAMDLAVGGPSPRTPQAAVVAGEKLAGVVSEFRDQDAFSGNPYGG